MKCSACNGAYHPSTGHRHGPNCRLCGPCARQFLTWLKKRMGMMQKPQKGNSISFHDAAMASNGACQ